ncbi:molecular chaperone [Klebsiella grimontii]|uniref:Molecular chaperone n=1 Tax=Klebsiella grimontii TaxID=2058152 RepID=A0ABU9PAZ1_9ENTR|nr:molecular chaperone [Klebsiella grimontii]MDU4542872.1 molecular chaperone [Klebsiella michiganensis]MBX4825180.1 molecular chaperone [Klebsiella grimontii]MBZ6954022.1 molecular chaperone [Klebsiella grimontii]MDU6355609.1 molecular chaperone [Klebsiella grimontii]MDU6530582.1 molecular chaperone [Klebsiella grimontii]
MFKSLLKIMAVVSLTTTFTANAGVVIDSTRHLYKEGVREINANLENKDNIPYLIKSWIEPREGSSTSFFMVTPPLFRLEANQRNTLRIFPNANIAGAPKDRETVYFFNVMSIPPTNDTDTEKNKIQLAVRHRMRLIYRPLALQELSINQEAKKLEWRRSNNKITVKNTTPFFMYFKSIKINGAEVSNLINNIDAFTTREFTLPTGINGSQIEWKIATDNGGMGTAYSSTL